MLWVDEASLPAWPPGPADGVTVRALRAAKDAARRLAASKDEDAGPQPPDGDAA